MMIFSLDTHSGVPIYRQIMDQIRQQIMVGQLNEGDQLEQVRSLALRLKVNPMTVSKAYGFLEREGILERQRGIGIFVAKQGIVEKQRVKIKILEESIKKSASLAARMDVSEEEAEALFRKFYRSYHSGKGVRDRV